MIKRLLSWLLAVCLFVSCLTGCGVTPSDPDIPSTAETSPMPADEELPAAFRQALSRSVILLEGSTAAFARGMVAELPEGAVALTLEQLLYIPALFVTEGLSGSWSYDPDTDAFTLLLGQITLHIPVNAVTMTVNGTPTVCQGVSFPVGEELMVCAQDYCRAMGLELQQDNGIAMVGTGLSQAGSTISEASGHRLSSMLRSELSSVSGAASSAFAELIIDPSEVPLETLTDKLVAYAGDLYVENLSVTNSPVYEHGYRCSMTVYNYLGYYYGIAEVYDREGQLVQTEQLKPYTGMNASFGGWFKDAAVLLQDLSKVKEHGDWDYLAYRSGLNATANRIVLDIPPDGYVRITSNMAQSDQLAVYNYVHLLVEMLSSCGSLIKLFAKGFTFDSCKDEIKAFLVKKLLSNGNMASELAMDFRNMISSVSVADSGFQYAQCVNTLWTKMTESLQRMDLDPVKLLELAYEAASGVGDAAMKNSLWKNAPPTAAALYSWEISSNISNMICLIGDMVGCRSNASLVIRVEGWREAYANFLKENQESLGHARYYEKGQGRFTLGYLTDDGIPELIIIDSNDTATVYTYDDLRVRSVGFACGSTDIVRFPYEDVYWNADHEVLIRKDGGWDRFVPYGRDYYDYVLEAELFSRDGSYYSNSFALEKMVQDGYAYRWEAQPRGISDTTYAYLAKLYGLSPDSCSSIRKEEIYSITPDVIQHVLGY